MHPARAIAVAATLGIAATAAAIWLPFIPLAYESDRLHTFFATSGALVNLLTAYLVYGRVRRTAALNDVALVYALVLAGSAALLTSILSGTGLPTRGSFLAWAPLVTQFIGSIFFAISAVMKERILSRPPSGTMILAAAFVTLAPISVVVGLLAPVLPVGVDPAVAVGRPLQNIWFSGALGQHAIQYLMVAAYVIAAFGFASRAMENKDELKLWLATGSTLRALARVNFVLFPSLFTTWVYVGDVLRFAANLVILFGAGKEIRGYWRNAAENAVADERRRMARDLHDGLSQELTFIWRESRRLAATGDGPAAPMIASAAERALDESRQAIAALTRPDDEPVATSIAKAAEQVGDRAGIKVKLKLDRDIWVDGETRETFLRIVREAVANAGKHSGASEVEVSLRAEDAIHLEICDDGHGFEPDRVEKSYTFGLISMRERAENMSAAFDLSSRPGVGTKIEIVLPFQISAGGRIAVRKLPRD